MKLSMLFSVLLLFSCLQKEKESTLSSDLNKRGEIADDTAIFGKWALCAIRNDNILTQLNMCQNIEFEKEGKGKINFVESFDWSFKNFHLKISNFLSPENLTLSTGEYVVNIIREKDLTTLIINQGQTSLYLTK